MKFNLQYLSLILSSCLFFCGCGDGKTHPYFTRPMSIQSDEGLTLIEKRGDLFDMNEGNMTLSAFSDRIELSSGRLNFPFYFVVQDSLSKKLEEKQIVQIIGLNELKIVTNNLLLSQDSPKARQLESHLFKLSTREGSVSETSEIIDQRRPCGFRYEGDVKITQYPNGLNGDYISVSNDLTKIPKFQTVTTRVTTTVTPIHIILTETTSNKKMSLTYRSQTFSYEDLKFGNCE